MVHDPFNILICNAFTAGTKMVRKANCRDCPIGYIIFCRVSFRLAVPAPASIRLECRQAMPLIRHVPGFSRDGGSQAGSLRHAYCLKGFNSNFIK